MTVIFSGNDYVPYSMLKVYNVSLKFILHEVIAKVKATIYIFTSDLENKLKQTYIKTVNSLRTNIHKDHSLTHSLTHHSLTPV